MNDAQPSGSSIPDALIAWTTSGALIAFGIIFWNDAVIMWRTILALGLLSAFNEALKLRALRNGSSGAYHHIRLLLAIAYAALIFIGFFFPPSGS